MDVFALLGVGHDADERTIKRAYARLLKQTRPDEDPAAFQRLHEAYQAALAYSRNRPQDEDEEDWHVDEARDPATVAADGDALTLHWSPGSDPASPMPGVSAALEDILGAGADHDSAPPQAALQIPTPPDTDARAAVTGPESADTLPAPPPLQGAIARHAFDPWQFFEDLVERATARQTEQLAAWLGQHPALYDLDHKRQAAHVVQHGIETREIALSAKQAALLAQFFGIEDHAWSTRATVRWLVQQDYTADYGEPSTLAVRQLKRPFQWKRALLYASIPTLAPRIAALGHRLADEYGRLPPGIDHEQHAFFVRMADPTHLGRWRWASMLLRSVCVGMFVAISGLVFAEQKLWVFGIAAAYLGGFFALETGLLLARLQMHWQRTPGATPLQRCAPVLLAVAGVLLGIAWPAADWLAYALIIVACLVHWRRFFSLLRFSLGSWWVGAWLLGRWIDPALVALALAPVWIAAADALHAWRKRIPLAAVDDNRWTIVLSYVVFGAGLLASLIFS